MRIRRAIMRLAAVCLLCVGTVHQGHATKPEPVSLRILGGLGGISQYARFEQPFWSKELATLSSGAVTATIHPFDRSGVPGQEMLRLIRLGVAPFGTALVSLISGDEPLLSAIDLPALNPDIATLKANRDRLRPLMAEVLRERYNIELLAIYAYPAQVTFCTQRFAGLSDLAGRRIRASSVGQAELLSALGAIPVMLPFAEVPDALKKGVVDCAVTGTLSGFEIGLAQETSFVHADPLTWGISLFGANIDVWQSLPADARDLVRTGVADLERRIWEAAERDTEAGLLCGTGRAACTPALRKPLALVPATAADREQRRRLLNEFVVPHWIERCGGACEKVWNEILAPANRDAVPILQAAGNVPSGAR